MTKGKDWAKSVGSVVVVLVFLGGFLSSMGVLPWATESKVAAFIELKNQDNEWYRELSVKVGKIETNVENIKDSQDEMKVSLREIRNLMVNGR